MPAKHSSPGVKSAGEFLKVLRHHIAPSVQKTARSLRKCGRKLRVEWHKLIKNCQNGLAQEVLTDTWPPLLSVVTPCKSYCRPV